MKKFSLIGVLLTLSAAFLWGTVGTAQSLAPGSASPCWLGALRLVLACLFFQLLFAYRQAKNTATTSTEGQQVAAQRHLYWGFVVGAGVCMGLYNLAFFAGVKATGIAVGTATTIGSAPIWAGLLEAVWLRKSPSALWWGGVLCATSGGIWMVLSQSASWVINPVGLMTCLGAGFCYALYTLLSKRLVAIASPLTITKHTFAIAMLIAVPVAWGMAGTPSLALPTWLIIAYLGICTTGIAYLLFTLALKHMSAATCVALGLFEPIVAFALAIMVAREPISMLAFGGLCLILAGLWLVLRGESAPNQ